MDGLCGQPVLLSSVYREDFSVDNAPVKREADHTAPSRFEVKNSSKYATYIQYDKSYGRQ